MAIDESFFGKKTGFTLVELLVAVAILGIVGGIATTILFTTLKSASKADVLREVKQNGDYATSVMERMIRGATSVTTCTGSMTSLTINNPDGWTTFSLSGTQIASISAIGTGYLTNNKVRVLNPPGLNFVCTRTPGKPDYVTVSFTLSQLGTSTRPEETATINFKTTVSLRTY